MSGEVKLMPCPKCGNEPKAGFMGDEDGGYGYVECHGDGDGHFCGVHADDEQDAVRIWNTRPTVVTDVERVARAIAPVIGKPLKVVARAAIDAMQEGTTA